MLRSFNSGGLTSTLSSRRARLSTRDPPLADLPEAARHLADHAFVRRSNGRPGTRPVADLGPFALVEGLHLPSV